MTVGPDATGKDFTCTPTGTGISRRVVDTQSDPIAGVTITDRVGHYATSNSNGDCWLTWLSSGPYTVYPYKTGSTFSPASPSATVPPAAGGRDFVWHRAGTYDGYLPVVLRR